MQVIAAAITAMGIKHALIGIRMRVLCTYPIDMTPNIVQEVQQYSKNLI